MSALDDIAAERLRQVEVEGWAPQHDAAHTTGELAGAAACYAMHGLSIQNTYVADLAKRTVGALWPWHPRWWKPTTRRRDLVKAGALIVAEIERLDRASASST